MTKLTQSTSGSGNLYWFFQGVKGLFCIPALVLIISMVGFAGLAREAGVEWHHAVFMTLAIWAMPAQIIMIGSIAAGVSLPAIALAVALSSARLMPMVVALTPELRAPQTRKSSLVFLSLFVSITSWVFAMEKLPSAPREKRTIYFAGFAVTLTLINTLVVAIAFTAMGHFPSLVAGAFAFLTPVYFLMSLFGSAREASGRFALFFGIVFLPITHWLVPELDILLAGVFGGLTAYGIGQLKRQDKNKLDRSSHV